MGSFQSGLLNLANWVGNVVLPIGAGLILAYGIYQFSKGQELEPYVWGAMAALLGSGLLRLAEVISQQNQGADQYMVTLLTLTNVVGNVLKIQQEQRGSAIAYIVEDDEFERFCRDNLNYLIFMVGGRIAPRERIQFLKEFVIAADMPDDHTARGHRREREGIFSAHGPGRDACLRRSAEQIRNLCSDVTAAKRRSQGLAGSDSAIAVAFADHFTQAEKF